MFDIAVVGAGPAGLSAAINARKREKSVVVIGNEGHGVSPEVSAACECGLYIPISEKTESLNASVAAAILMWEQSKAD